MIQQSAVLADFHGPEKRLANSILLEAVKSIKNCPKSIRVDGSVNRHGARTRLIKALEALEDAIMQPKMFVFWCEVAEIDVDWISRNIKTLAEDRPILMKAWEAHNAK